jgi:hypothetical protein
LRVSIIERGLKSNFDFTVKPNPGTGQYNVMLIGCDSNEPVVTYTLLDLTGRVVFTKKTEAVFYTTLNITHLAKGSYYLKVENKNLSKIKKIVLL